jgi:ubiquinone/menaquinone biosynthesis C-methylase UbiE
MRNIQNHFAGVANQYAAFRPTYPRQLLADLATLVAGEHTVALDVAAGNGQATSMLADYVDHVYASDVALSQIQAMPAHPQISAYVARAEASGLQAHCIDLITVAQAMHWFDVDAFHREVRRVVRPGGLIAVWSYALLHATPALNDVINDIRRNE